MHLIRQPGLIVSCLPERALRQPAEALFLWIPSCYDRTLVSTESLRCVTNQLMLGRIAVSLTLVTAMFVAETSASSTCFVPDSPSQKTCAAPCCGTKPCCATSEKRDTQSVPPFTTSTSSQQTFVASTPAVADIQLAPPLAIERSQFLGVDVQWHSPETLALLCIRLI